jgi:hypothetical protein
MKDLKLWLSISNLRNVPNSLLLYSRIADYADDLFEISEDEDDLEVLRRVSIHMLIICVGLKRDLLYRENESI